MSRESRRKASETAWERRSEALRMFPMFESTSKTDLAVAAVRLIALLEGNADDYSAGARRLMAEVDILAVERARDYAARKAGIRSEAEALCERLIAELDA